MWRRRLQWCVHKLGNTTDRWPPAGAARETWNRFSPRTLRRSMALPYLILHFWPPDWETKVHCLQPPSSWSFVSVAPGADSGPQWAIYWGQNNSLGTVQRNKTWTHTYSDLWAASPVRVELGCGALRKSRCGWCVQVCAPPWPGPGTAAMWACPLHVRLGPRVWEACTIPGIVTGSCLSQPRPWRHADSFLLISIKHTHLPIGSEFSHLLVPTSSGEISSLKIW